VASRFQVLATNPVPPSRAIGSGFLLATISACAVAVFSSCAAAPLSAGGSASAADTAARGGTGGAVSGSVRNPSIFSVTARSTKIAFLSPAALLSNNSSVASAIAYEQCRFDTPDPLFLVPDEGKQINWTFTGRLDEKPYFQAAEYRSIFTLGMKSGPLQLNTWPLQLTSLADLPDMFLEQRLNAIGRAQLNPSDQRELVQEYMQQQRRIQNWVIALMNAYTPESCRTAAKQ
jgi:hypothetical protein